MNPLTTPNNVLTDCLNGTMITYNGNEFVLQNDMGNCKVERAKLSSGFIPVGMKEYGGIVYVASYNPETKACEVGSFPSPERDFSTNDFENIEPANFKTSQFVVDTNNNIKEKTSVITKLFEPELLQLHPGDMYVVTYKINDPNVAVSNDPNEIDNNIKLNNFISADEANRKLFRLKFYKITNNNNVKEMPSNELAVIEDRPNVEDAYVYFKGTSDSTLAVGLELEQLDMFEANVIDRSRKTISAKKIAIEAVGFSDSLVDFKGVKVDVQEPQITSFFVEKSIGKKIACEIGDLVANSNFRCSLTPYSSYALYPKLKKDFQIELGKYAYASNGVNDIFRYKTTDDYISVDFDFKFEGDTPDGVQLYVEFYDPWSDYSVVKVVDSPTFYGVNNILVELVDEPAIDLFDSETRGGTPRNMLAPNSDLLFQKTLLNKTNFDGIDLIGGLIRTTATLRKNHFYIVRISGVDRDTTTNPITYKHYDLYKGMYTNKMFNKVYDIQNSLKDNDPRLERDFNNLDFVVENIKYETTVKEVSDIAPFPTITSTRDDLKTDGKYYRLMEAIITDTSPYKVSKNHSRIKEYQLDRKLVGVDNLFGTFKDSLMQVTTPTIPTGTILDQNWDLDTDISPESNSITDVEVLIPKTKYKLNLRLNTKRSVAAPISAAKPVVGTAYEELSLLPTFYSLPNNGPYADNRKAAIQVFRSDLYARRSNGTAYHDDTDYSDDNNVHNAMNAITAGRKYSVVATTIPDYNFRYSSDTGADEANRDSITWQAHKKTVFAFQFDRLGFQSTLVRVYDFNLMLDFFSNLKVASNVTKNLYAYYANTANLKQNGNIITSLNTPKINITSKLVPDSNTGGPIKTRLSTFRFKALGTIEEFSNDVLNTYINSRKGSSIIVDSKLTIADGFIPYINNEIITVDEVIIPVISIEQTADVSIATAMENGEQDYTNDSTLSPPRYDHGKLFSDKATEYGKYVDMLELQEIYPNTIINPNTVYVRLKAGLPFWEGHWVNRGNDTMAVKAPDMVYGFDLNQY